MVKIILVVVAALSMFASSIAMATESVSGYHRKGGKYVQSYKRSNPDKRRYNNYSSKGNSNPYTGKKGTSGNEFSSPSKHNKKPDGTPH